MKYRKQIAYILSIVLITGLLSGIVLASAKDMPYWQGTSQAVSMMGTASGPGITGEATSGPGITGETTSGPGIIGETTSGPGITDEPTSDPEITATPTPTGLPVIKVKVNNTDNTFLGVKVKGKANLSVILTDEKGNELEETEDYVCRWYLADKKKKVGRGRIYKPVIKKAGLYKYSCRVTDAETGEEIGRSETISVLGYTTNLSVVLPKNQKGGVSSAKLASAEVRKELLGLKKKDAKSIVIKKMSRSKKADKINKKNIAVTNKSVKVKTYLKGKKAKKALEITVQDKDSKQEFTIKDITVESKLKNLPAANVTMKLSQKNTLLTVTFKKVKGISYIKFGPTGKKPDKIVKNAKQSTYVVRYRNRAGFKSNEFRIAAGYKTKYGIQYSAYVKKALKKSKKK